jgi:hypothetical protein
LRGLDFVATAQMEKYHGIARLCNEAEEAVRSPQWEEYDPNGDLTRKFVRVIGLVKNDAGAERLFEAVDDLENAMANAPRLPARY